MIARDIFYERLRQHCEPCSHWSGRCLKGHSLQSPAGCPLKKFPPVDGAAYFEDRPAPPAAPPPEPCFCSPSAQEDLKPLTWPEALRSLQESVDRWKRAGKPLTPEPVYQARFEICRNCTDYRWFQCRLCKCVAMVKGPPGNGTVPAPVVAEITQVRCS